MAEAADEERLVVTLREVYKAREAQLEDELRKTRVSLDSLEQDPGSIRYEVNLLSSWSREGEQNVTTKRKGPLRRAVKGAERLFMRINNRGDVQATYIVLAVAGKGGATVTVPEKFVSALIAKKR